MTSLEVQEQAPLVREEPHIARQTASKKVSFRSLAPPAPLIGILSVALILGVVWSLVTPPFQAPDENPHFGYVQQLAEKSELPGIPGRPVYSSEQLAAASVSNSTQTSGVPDTKPTWSRSIYQQWLSRSKATPKGQRADGGGANPASSNPPLYYLLEAGIYRAAAGSDLFTRLTVLRLGSVFFLLIAVMAVWLLAGELFKKERLAQITAASLVALEPMITFICGSVSPDSMLIALWSLTLWVGVHMLRRGITIASAFALLSIVGAACVVKATSYALIPAALMVLVVSTWRKRKELTWRSRVAIGISTVAGIGTTLGIWFTIAHGSNHNVAAQVSELSASQTVSHTNIRELLSYVWQFYLPNYPGQTPFRGISSLPLYDVWLKGSWGSFGWLEVPFPNSVYLALAAACAVATIAAVKTMWSRRRRIDFAIVAFFGLVVLALFAGLHWTEYHLIKAGAGAFNQGRYLLPLIGIAAVIGVLASRAFGQRLRVAVVGLFLIALFGLQVLALAINGTRYFA